MVQGSQGKKKRRFNLLQLLGNITKHHVGAYAAQAAFFFMLSLIPMLLILVTIVIRYTALTKAEVLSAILTAFPRTVQGLMSSIVNQVYGLSGSVLPLTVLAAVWSAGKGVLSMSTGMNLVYESKETRNFIYIRIRASLYTVFFIVLIVVFLVLSVFGSSIKSVIEEHVPFMAGVFSHMLRTRVLTTTIILFVFTMVFFKFLPNRQTKLRYELPGTIFTSAGWAAISWLFSVYLQIFTGFKTMYGSMATIILIMLWLYFCMYCILLGAEINRLVFPKAEEHKPHDIKENVKKMITKTIKLDN